MCCTCVTPRSMCPFLANKSMFPLFRENFSILVNYGFSTLRRQKCGGTASWRNDARETPFPRMKQARTSKILRGDYAKSSDTRKKLLLSHFFAFYYIFYSVCILRNVMQLINCYSIYDYFHAMGRLVLNMMIRGTLRLDTMKVSTNQTVTIYFLREFTRMNETSYYVSARSNMFSFSILGLNIR